MSGRPPVAQYIYERAAATGKRAQCFGGAKNHAIIMPDADMDQTVDALVGAGYGAAGERCMAVSVAVPVGKTTAERLMEKLIPRVENLKIGPSIDPTADFGPLVTMAALERVKNYVEIGIQEGAKLAVDGRGFKMQGYENGFYMGGCLFDNVTKDMRIYKEEIFGPVLSVVRATTTMRRWACRPSTNTATALRSSPATATRRAISPPRSMSAWSASMCQSRCRSRTTRSVAGSDPVSAISINMGRIRFVSIPRPRR